MIGKEESKRNSAIIFQFHFIYSNDHLASLCMKIFPTLSNRHKLTLLMCLQLEERIVTLLGVWENWSLFPSNFLRGLESFFFLSEVDSLGIKESMKNIPEQIPKESKEHSESIRRKAKLLGVTVLDGTSVEEMLAKIEYVEKYIRNKNTRGREDEEFSITVSAGARETDRDRDGNALQRNVVGYEDEEDIDGLPMTTTALGIGMGIGIGISHGQEGEGAYDDDLDGVPLDAPGVFSSASGYDSQNRREGGQFVTSQHGNGNSYDDDDDVDGIPLDLPTNITVNYGVPSSTAPGKRRRGSEDISNSQLSSEHNSGGWGGDRKSASEKNSVSKSKSKKARKSADKYASDSGSESDDDQGPGRIDFL